MTTTEKFSNFPPALIRLLARHRYGRPLTEAEISANSGLALHLVQTYSWFTSWDNMPLSHAFAFLRGCGLGIDDTIAWRRITGYLSHRPTFRYLRASPHWESLYQPLLKGWRLSVGPVTRDSDLYQPLKELCIRLNLLLK